MQVASDAQLRVITKASNNQKFEFEGQKLTPAELIEKVKNGHWKPLNSNRFSQRLRVHHHNYGEVVLIIRKKTLKNGKIIMMYSRFKFFLPKKLEPRKVLEDEQSVISQLSLLKERVLP
jgi:hypothetical protein